MNWWNLSVFLVVPVLSVVVIFCVRRRALWTAPLLSTAVSVVLSIAAMPSLFRDPEHRAMFLGIVLPMHLAVVLALTVLACVIAYLLHRR